MDYVWGYTIINDMTARERQRDHKQFYIGKSPDTFCPIGPVAVHKSQLPDVLKIETTVNGEKRQSATTDQLIFSIPNLVKTLSEGQTLQPGDVLATGTPYGVGFGFRPMIFLKPGDEISISVTGLGTLTNRISASSTNPTAERAKAATSFPISNTGKLRGQQVQVSGKRLFYRQAGSTDASAIQVVCIHGLGGTSDYFTPLVQSLGDTVSLHLLDFEGHGLSETSAASQLSLASLAGDITEVLKLAKVEKAAVVAHSMGSLIAVQLALDHPELVTKLLLMGPPPSPLPEAGAKAVRARAGTVRKSGMLGVVDAIVGAGTSPKSQAERPLAISAVRLSLMGQDPEGYAKACTALAGAAGLDFSKLQCSVSLITGADDKTSPPELCKKYQSQVSGSTLQILDGVGHWHLFEDVGEVQNLVRDFLKA
jgi:pimeloyl-ACP methyl ester carboxylesterase